MPKTRREERREQTIAEIRQRAWAQIAAGGPEGLSLRAISREMRMSSPALFRYFPNRNALLTALIQEAFRLAGEAMAQAVQAAPDDPRRRIQAACLAYRDWGIHHPEKYALIYGSPVAGYSPDWAVYLAEAQQSLGLIVEQLAQAWQSGALRLPTAPLPASLVAQLDEIVSQRGMGVPARILYDAITGWTRLHGIVSLEIFGHLGPLLPDPAAFYQAAVDDLLAQAGYPAPSGPSRPAQVRESES
ncbi:MAG: TetR/AcrR family transcriptional regulator [Chloroflexi bacterium]|nr:TetR/AcrR family transcriptional regulator [Chloroflexota bacterium]